MHRVVKVKTVTDAAGEKQSFYGVTYNNVLIPEYTETPIGKYAPSYEAAEQAIDTKVPEIDPWIGNKYNLPNPVFYRVANTFSSLGMLVSAPFAIPVSYVGDRFFHDKSLGPRLGFKEVVADYFEMPYDEAQAKAIGTVSRSTAL